MFCQRLQLCFFHFFPTLFRCRHALHCAKAMILAAQAPAISPHSFLFRNRSVDGRFSSAIRANHCFFLLLRPTPLRVVGFASAERQSRCPQRSFRFAQPSLRPTPALRAVVGFGAAVLLRSVLTPRCFAPFFGLRPHLRWRVGFAAALPRWGVLTARCFAPFFAAHPASRRGLRGCGTASQCPHPSVLRTLLCGPPRFASWASGLRYCFAVSSPLGASHPFFGLLPPYGGSQASPPRCPV